MFKHSVIDFIELNPNEINKYRLAIDSHCSYNPQSARLVEKNKLTYSNQVENLRVKLVKLSMHEIEYTFAEYMAKI